MKKRNIVFLTLLFMCCTSVSSLATKMSPMEIYRQGIAAYENGEHEKAIDLLKMAIEGGVRDNIRNDASCKILDLYLITNDTDKAIDYRCRYDSQAIKKSGYIYDTNSYNDALLNNNFQPDIKLNTSQGLKEYLKGEWVQIKVKGSGTQKIFSTFKDKEIKYEMTKFNKFDYYETGKYYEKKNKSVIPVKYMENLILDENEIGKNDEDQFYKITILSKNYFCFPPMGVKFCFERINSTTDMGRYIEKSKYIERSKLKKAGNDYYDNDQPHKAILAYLKALEVSEGNGSVLTDLGVAYRRINEYEKSERSFLRAAEINPYHSQAYLNLGILYRYDIGDNEKAIDAWRKYLSVRPLGKDSDMVRDELKLLGVKYFF